MAKFKSEVLGGFGEDIAIRYLQSKGFELVAFGVGGKSAASKLMKSTPSVSGYWIGSSRVDLAALQLSNDNVWISGKTPSWADLTDDEIALLTSICRSTSKCDMRDGSAKKCPCGRGIGLFSQDNLEGAFPKGVSVVHKDGVKQRRSAMHFAYECSNRFSELIASDHRGDVLPLGGFMRDNELISGYIRKLWEKYAVTDLKLPYSGADIRNAGMSTPEAEAMKNANRARLAVFPAGHPGRFDYIAKDDAGLVAVEVKVNTSKMSYWQELRFMLLNKLGHRTMLVNVKGTHESLERSCMNSDFSGVTVEVSHNPAVAAKELDGYSFLEIMETVPRNWIYF
ncbi:hypothetical protein [Pseudomonas fluorescens]